MGTAWRVSGEEPTAEELQEREKRVAFFQSNFSKFVPVGFVPTTDGDAAIQILRLRTNTFKYNGGNYCGFRFTVPAWLDGDFEWIQLLDKSEDTKDFFAKNFEWYIFPENGRCEGFTHFMRSPVLAYAKLRKRFPYTKNVFEQYLDRESLVPGKTYAIWIRYEPEEMPDLAFSITINSERGHKEFGKLPLR